MAKELINPLVGFSNGEAVQLESAQASQPDLRIRTV